MLKQNVLRNKKDFSTIYNKGKSFGGKYVVLFVRRNNLSYNRLGFLASKKVGNSVLRNRSRRLMKESYRLLEPKIGTGYDLIFIARNTINGVKNAEVLKCIEFLTNRAGILKK